jgi:hypothetical protein
VIVATVLAMLFGVTLVGVVGAYVLDRVQDQPRPLCHAALFLLTLWLLAHAAFGPMVAHMFPIWGEVLDPVRRWGFAFPLATLVVAMGVLTARDLFAGRAGAVERNMFAGVAATQMLLWVVG